jgi:hypothetical protein
VLLSNGNNGRSSRMECVAANARRDQPRLPRLLDYLYAQAVDADCDAATLENAANLGLA